MGDLLGYICKFADEVKQGPAAQLYYPLTPEGCAQAEAFARANDQKGFSIYSCIGALRTAPRNKENVGALDKIVLDLDLRVMREDREQVLETLRKLPLLPEIRDSGRGIHTVWHLKEPLVDEAGMAQAEAIMRRLAALLAGDPVPTHRAALLRHIGTHNSRDGGWRECHVIAHGTTCDVSEFSELFDLYDGATLLHYKDDKVPATAATTVAPVDIDASLAAIAPGNINDTRTRVAAAMIMRGFPIEAALGQIIEEMRVALGEHAQGWDWNQERIDCEWSCYRFVNKKMKERVDVSNCLPKVHFDKWQEMLRAGRQPVLSRNSFGFFVRNGKNEPQAEPSKPIEAVITAPVATTSERPRRRFKLTRFSDLKMEVDEDLYLIDEFIPSTGLTIVYGQKKCFKSFTVLDAMLHVAKGWTWHGRAVRQGPVIYAAFEGTTGIKHRKVAASIHYELGGEGDYTPLFVLSGNVNLIMDHKGLINDFRDELKDAGETKNPVAVVLDTLNKSLVGSESKDVDMSNYIRAAEAIREAFKCAVIIIHHTGHDEMRPRGHSALSAAVDAQLQVTRNGDNATILVEHMRDGPEEISLTVSTKKIQVGFDRNGKAIESLVVVPLETSERPAPIRARGWPKALVVFRDALAEAVLSHGSELLIEDGPMVRAVASAHVRAAFYKTYFTDPDDAGKDPQQARRRAFVRCLQQAQAKSLIGVRVLPDGQQMVWIASPGSSHA